MQLHHTAQLLAVLLLRASRCARPARSAAHRAVLHSCRGGRLALHRLHLPAAGSLLGLIAIGVLSVGVDGDEDFAYCMKILIPQNISSTGKYIGFPVSIFLTLVNIF